MTGPLDRLDASEYGDDDGRPVDVGPPCDECGRREAIGRFRLGGEDKQLCGSCAPDVDVEQGGRS